MRIGRILVAISLPFLFAAGAQAQSLVPNSGFDHDLSGWTLQQGNTAWANLDSNVSPASGSLHSLPDSSGTSKFLSGCFPAYPGAYHAGFKYLLTQPGPNYVNMFVRWYTDDACSHFNNNSISLNAGYAGSAWQTIDANSFDLVAPGGTQSAAVQFNTAGEIFVDDVVVQRKDSCAPGTCLNGDRFSVVVRWVTGQSNGGGREVRLTPDSAYFWFFDPNNIELVVKVLDGCAVNGQYWVFMGGLTNVRVEVTVTDVVTGAVKTYVNLEGHAFQPIQDISAFPSSSCL